MAIFIPLEILSQEVTDPVKIKHERGGEIWQYNSTHQVYRSAPAHVFNNENGLWVAHDLDILGNGDYDVLSGLIGTRFQGETIIHYNPLTIYSRITF